MLEQTAVRSGAIEVVSLSRPVAIVVSVKRGAMRALMILHGAGVSRAIESACSEGSLYSRFNLPISHFTHVLSNDKVPSSLQKVCASHVVTASQRSTVEGPLFSSDQPKEKRGCWPRDSSCVMRA